MSLSFILEILIRTENVVLSAGKKKVAVRV